MGEHPTSTDQALQSIIEALSVLPEVRREEEAKALASFLAQEFASSIKTRGLIEADIFNRTNYYVIHDDDLKLLSEAAPVAAAVYAAFPNPVAIAAGLIVFLFRYRRKRVRLNLDQAIALRAIDQSGTTGATIGELMQRLPPHLRDEVIIAPVLESLIAVRREDGTLAKVLEMQDHRYFALDV